MYKHLTKDDWKHLLKIPDEYVVDTLIVNGAGKKEEALNTFKNILSKNKQVSKVSNLQDSFFQNVLEFNLKEKKIWFDVAYGGAYLSELIHIACLFGSKKNFLVGSCGGLQKELKTGDIIIPTYTYGNESTTRMYQESGDNKHYSDEKLSSNIKNAIDKKYTVRQGPLITCQSMMAETQEDVDTWEKEGYLGVEMESSTFFAISNHFNVPSTAIIHISDNLVKNELVGDKNYALTKQLREDLKEYKYKTILEKISSE